MPSILDGVDQRTQLAGHNRMELLVFKLNGSERYGINVFKIQEVVPRPVITRMPSANPAVCGVSTLRGETMPIIDLAVAIGESDVVSETASYVIVTEYNRTIQGFLVQSVEHIENVAWDHVKPPPAGLTQNYLTAIAEIDEQLIEIIDVEKVLSEIIPDDKELDEETVEKHQQETSEQEHPVRVFIVDDSVVARNQIKRTMEQLNFECILAKNGQEAIEMMESWIENGSEIHDHIDVMISDVEMPKMDGYTLTRLVRENPELENLYIILHTSLSGVFNNALVDKVGADEFVAKFNPDELAEAIMRYLRIEPEEEQDD